MSPSGSKLFQLKEIQMSDNICITRAAIQKFVDARTPAEKAHVETYLTKRYLMPDRRKSFFSIVNGGNLPSLEDFCAKYPVDHKDFIEAREAARLAVESGITAMDYLIKIESTSNLE